MGPVERNSTVTGPESVDISQRARAALHQLAVLELDQETTQTVLQRVVELLQQVMPEGSEASMTVIRAGRPATAAFTGQRARDLDEVQYASGYGPCLEAAIGGLVVEVTDARSEQRWPDYIPVLLNSGALSSLAVPAPAAQFSAGLNVYARTVEAFTEEDRQAAQRFADVAAVALTNVGALHESRELAENLRVAMESRAVIEQAKGVLIERYKLTPDQAFQMLAQASQRANRKVRDLAEDLVLTGELDSGGPS